MLHLRSTLCVLPGYVPNLTECTTELWDVATFFLVQENLLEKGHQMWRDRYVQPQRSGLSPCVTSWGTFTLYFGMWLWDFVHKGINYVRH